MLADCSLSPLCLHALIIEDWSRDVLRGAWPATVQGLNAVSVDFPDVRRDPERDGRLTEVIARWMAGRLLRWGRPLQSNGRDTAERRQAR